MGSWGTSLVTGHHSDVAPFTINLSAWAMSQLVSHHVTVIQLSAGPFVQKDTVRHSIKTFPEIQNETKIQYLEIEARSNQARNQVGSYDFEDN